MSISNILQKKAYVLPVRLLEGTLTPLRLVCFPPLFAFWRWGNPIYMASKQIIIGIPTRPKTFAILFHSIAVKRA